MPPVSRAPCAWRAWCAPVSAARWRRLGQRLPQRSCAPLSAARGGWVSACPSGPARLYPPPAEARYGEIPEARLPLFGDYPAVISGRNLRRERCNDLEATVTYQCQRGALPSLECAALLRPCPPQCCGTLSCGLFRRSLAAPSTSLWRPSLLLPPRLYSSLREAREERLLSLREASTFPALSTRG